MHKSMPPLPHRHRPLLAAAAGLQTSRTNWAA